MSKSIASVIKTDDYQLNVVITPLKTNPEDYNFELVSYWEGAKNPKEPQVKYQAIVDKKGLKRLYDSIGHLINN